MTPYLYAHQNQAAPVRANGRRFWGYPKRTARIDLIVVHTTESAFDLIGEDTGAEGVARFQSTTERPSSYHQICDRDSTVLCLPDEAVAFGVVGYNSRALSVSLAMRAADWTDPAKARAAEPTLRRTAAVVAEWCRAHDVPVALITKAQADDGRRGITSHGRLDPGRRSDPGADFPWNLFSTLVRAALGTPTSLPSLTEGPDMIVVLSPSDSRQFLCDRFGASHIGGNELAALLAAGVPALDDKTHSDTRREMLVRRGVTL